MLDKKSLVGLAHLVCTGLLLKIFSFILPIYLTSHYSCAANLMMLIIVAKVTYGYTKKNFLNERVQSEKKAVLITGCDSGFGNGLARRLDLKGYHVFASCLDDEGEGAKELRDRCTNRLQVLKMDVTCDESVKKAFELVKKHTGDLDLEFWALVNNAGVLKGHFLELSDIDDFIESMKVNALGTVRVTKAFLPLLRHFKGRVVNVTSVAGKVAAAHIGPYTMSKFAATAFTECLRQEMLVWGVKVISIEPEFFVTPMVKLECILKSLENLAEKPNDVVKDDYGVEYVKSLKTHLEGASNICSPKVTKVLGDLELAISLKNPDTTYRPCRNNVFKLFYYIAEIAPNPLKDMFLVLYMYVTGFPVPKEASDGCCC